MKVTTYDKSSLRKLYKVKGDILAGPMYCKHQIPFEGYIMTYTSKYAHATIENQHKSPITSVAVDYDFNVYINPICNFSAVETASQNGYRIFLLALNKKNLDFVLIEHDKEVGLGFNKRIDHIIEWAVKFKEPKRVKFLVRNEIVDRKYIENMKLESGMSIVDYYDNGYSYISSDPLSPKQFLDRVDKMLALPFTWTYNGIQIVEKDNNFYIDCRIGQDKHFSEISNS